MRIGPFGIWEILIILVVVLLIFGPRRLPETASSFWCTPPTGCPASPSCNFGRSTGEKRWTGLPLTDQPGSRW